MRARRAAGGQVLNDRAMSTARGVIPNLPLVPTRMRINAPDRLRLCRRRRHVTTAEQSRRISRLSVADLEKTLPFAGGSASCRRRRLPGHVLLAITSAIRALLPCAIRLLSRYYIHCDRDAKLEDWPDDRFLAVIHRLWSEGMAEASTTVPSIESPLRGAGGPLQQLLAEPIHTFGRSLAGDGRSYCASDRVEGS